MSQENQYGQNPGYGQGGPSYASPQYGPGSYGQPVGPGGRAARMRGVGVIGLVIAVIGAAACVVSFTALEWIKSANLGTGNQNVSIKFSTLHDLASNSQANAPELSKLYFGWLAWVLVAVAFVLAVLAVLPTGASALMRGLGFIVGLGGAVVTLFALKGDGTSFGDLFDEAGIGFYFALAGFVVIAIGALFGPRRLT